MGRVFHMHGDDDEPDHVPTAEDVVEAFTRAVTSNFKDFAEALSNNDPRGCSIAVRSINPVDVGRSWIVVLATNSTAHKLNALLESSMQGDDSDSINLN